MHRVGARRRTPSSASPSSCTPSRCLSLDGLWTHCAVADEPDDPFTALQLERFDAAVAAVEDAGIRVPMRHAANSAAAIAHPASRYDLVRCGIAVYGIAPAPSLVDRLALEPAVRLATEVAFVKPVAAGERVSYGLLHTVERDTTVATLPIGYADGVLRRLGLEGQEVLIGGRRHPMIGVVTMDQVLVDLGPRQRRAGGRRGRAARRAGRPPDLAGRVGGPARHDLLRGGVRARRKGRAPVRTV